MSEDDYPGAVLLSDEIKRYAETFGLIQPFDPDNLKPASYKLTVGDECAIGGEYKKLENVADKNEITIRPFEVAVIKTNERIKMPDTLIARWNIRVSLAYKGLLWVGGPQVDPGYDGHLFCPVYNLSDKEVVLKLKGPLATIDFVKTTPHKEGISLPFKQKRFEFKDYDYKWKSALYTTAAKRIDEIENKVNLMVDKTEKDMEKVSSRLNLFTGTMFSIIAIVIAVLSILVASSQKVEVASPIWLYFSPIFSFVAIFISLWSLKARRVKGNWIDVVVLAFMGISTIAIVCIVVYIFWLVRSIFCY
jgi:deoxycytidine triphosphate deaminase